MKPRPLLLLTILGSAIAHSAEPEEYQRALQEAHQQTGVSAAVLVADQGEILLQTAIGNSGDQPLTADTLFEIASTSKFITALAVLKLAEDETLLLDESIRVLLPEVPENCAEITIRHLLQHTSGIPPTNVHGSGDQFAAVVPGFFAGGPRTTPGEIHAYWNQGYAVLSEIIARASGQPYTEYLRTHIFQPVGMDDTCFTGDPIPKSRPVATGMNAEGIAQRTALEHPYGSYGFQYRGMGGIVTNLNDLWALDRALRENRLLKAETFAEMIQIPIGNYGLGCRIFGNANAHGHGGSVRGFLCEFLRFPDRNGCIIILCNQSDRAAFSLLNRQIMSIYLAR